MSGTIFKGTALSLRDTLNQRITRYRTTLALQRDPNGKRANDYRRAIALLIDMVADIDRHLNAQATPEFREMVMEG